MHLIPPTPFPRMQSHPYFTDDLNWTQRGEVISHSHRVSVWENWDSNPGPSETITHVLFHQTAWPLGNKGSLLTWSFLACLYLELHKSSEKPFKTMLVNLNPTWHFQSTPMSHALQSTLLEKMSGHIRNHNDVSRSKSLGIFSPSLHAPLPIHWLKKIFT
jgi:hypothetical protein